MIDVGLHLLVILLIGLPIVEWTARRLRRLAIDGNAYRSIALLVHLLAFTVCELTFLPWGAVFAVSIAAIVVVYLIYEVATSRHPAAQAQRQQIQEAAIWDAAWRMYRQRSAHRQLVVVATYSAAHAHELMRRDAEILDAAGIAYQQHYILMGSTLVAPESAETARQLLVQRPEKPD
ncbi:MAG: hypothetical protein EA401_03030 [Planctomycetota bacterium]|nr:MAG: hypothetical protein EA401_03030 [Planctomycetota bacterium]